jgi:uncharacterized integral membrane protein
MATTYTSTIQLRCWKQHTCVGCGGNYLYELIRTIQGSAGTADGARANAQKNVQKAIDRDTDLHPCPTCGLHQPDMIAQRRSRRHWILFWVALLAAVVLLILVGTHTVQFNVATWLFAVLCGAAVIGSVLTERWNPNRDLGQNRTKAADLVSRGVLQHRPAQAPPADPGAGSYRQAAPGGAPSDKDLDQHARPGPTPLQIAALVLGALAVGAAIAPDVARGIGGWPANSDTYPPVIGPGDVARIYMNQKISSVKGYWRGEAKVVIKDGSRTIPTKGKANDNNWGGTIYAKSSEKDNSSTPWVAVTIPSDAKLAGKKVGCDVDLSVEYPSASGSSSFRTTTSQMHRSVTLELASPGAGDTYETVWWGATLVGVGLALVATLFLVGVAAALRKRAHPTQVFSPAS